ncbi:MAG: hypothetical protein ACWA5A_13555 [Marinibacterium sp.]
MGPTQNDDWFAQFKPRMLGKTELGSALRDFSQCEKAFIASLDQASARDAAPFAAYRDAWAALDRLEDSVMAAAGRDRLAAMGLGGVLKSGAITTRQQRLRDALADFVSDAPGGINHIVDLSQTCQDHMNARASMVSRFERAQMEAARCRIPAALRRLGEVRADIDTALREGLIEPEAVVAAASALHRTLSDLPGDFSAHLKALAMLRTAGLRLTHQKKPLWDWLKRAEAVLKAS